VDLIGYAVLFGPAALIGPPLLIAAHRGTRHDKAVLAMLADERAKRANAVTPADGDGPPPDGGQPTPIPDSTTAATTVSGDEGMAQVIPFLGRRAA